MANSHLPLAFHWVPKHWHIWMTIPICVICYPSTTGRSPGGQGEAQFLRVLPWLCLSNPGSSGVQEVQYCGASKFYLLMNGLKIFTRYQVNVENFDHKIGISKNVKNNQCLMTSVKKVDTLACVVLVVSLIFSLFLTLPPLSFFPHFLSLPMIFYLFLFFLSPSFPPSIS